MAKNPTSLGLPPREEYYVATVNSLRRRQHGASIGDIERDVAEALDLTPDALAVPHGDGRRTQFQYDLAWVRTYLKWAAVIENPQRGRWYLTPLGAEMSDDELRGIWKRIVAEQRADRKQIPKLPKQGAGPHFAIANGVLAFARTVDSNGNDRSRLKALRPIVLDTADALIRSLQKHEGLWPDLEKAARAYREILSTDPDTVDYGRLFGQGIILTNAVKVAKSDHNGGNAYPLAAEPTILADSLLDLHGPLILGTRDGQSLVADAERYETDSRQRREIRESEIELAKALSSPGAPAAVAVKDHISDILGAEHQAQRPDHQHSYRGGMIRNAAIVLAGGAVVSTVAAIALAGGAIPAAIAGTVFAIFGKDAIKNSKAGKEIGTQLTKLVDRATVDFVNDNEKLFRNLARQRHMSWLSRTLDWSAKQREQAPETQPGETLSEFPLAWDAASPHTMVAQAWSIVEFALRSYALQKGLRPNRHRSAGPLIRELETQGGADEELIERTAVLFTSKNALLHSDPAIASDDAQKFVSEAEEVYRNLRDWERRAKSGAP